MALAGSVIVNSVAGWGRPKTVRERTPVPVPDLILPLRQAGGAPSRRWS
jgi:hypothetical protein